MLEYKEGLTGAHFPLWRKYRQGFRSFAMMDTMMKRIIEGRFLLLKRFEQRTLGVVRNNQPVLLATLFLPKSGWPAVFPASIGCLAADPSLTAEEKDFFWQCVRDRYGHLKLVTPMNGHHYLGFASAPSDADPRRLGIATAAVHENNLMPEPATIYRSYWSLETALTGERAARLSGGDVPAGFQIRRFDRRHARRDFAILNQITNSAFTEHFDFAPLSDEECWDVFRFMIPLLSKDHLLFLYEGAKPVAFALGLYDYNRVFKPGPDLLNLARLAARPRPARARLVHIAIKPEYRGKKLVRPLRHQLLANFARQGVQVVESSYVDEGNMNSLGNVQSTGGTPLYKFQMYRVAPSAT